VRFTTLHSLSESFAFSFCDDSVCPGQTSTPLFFGCLGLFFFGAKEFVVVFSYPATVASQGFAIGREAPTWTSGCNKSRKSMYSPLLWNTVSFVLDIIIVDSL
jgi:hypothetical protein